MDWYAAVCRAHGIAFVRSARRWHSLSRMPPFYGNAVYLASRRPLALFRRIDAAVAGRAWGPGWGVKDALAVHDLSDAGFDLLFEARWLFRAPSRHAVADPRFDVRAQQSDPARRRWISAWGETPPGEVVFPDGFGDDPAICLLAAYQGDRCVGGIACNRSSNCVGISNTFGSEDAISACVLHAAAHTTLPLVGYEQGTSLDLFRELGFSTTGPLAVWTRQAA